MIREALAGKRIAVTGATGFLGTAVVERLLHAVPDCELALLVRPGQVSSAQERVRREIFRNRAFDRLRSELGDRFDPEMDRRVSVLSGDVSRPGLGLGDEDRDRLAGCDVVIHSAATVSFDSPLDTAVEVNLLGPTRAAEALTEAGSPAHLLSVSTCYVAGSRRGTVREDVLTDTPFAVELDWRAEVDAARRTRADLDAASRDPARLRKLRRDARAELGAAGTPLLSDRTEALRTAWVAQRMTEAGRARAQSAGWPDAYAYTKALGERALLETRGEIPVTIVRPSIIESALAEPAPGWIRGFRMAEPVIVGYARGLLREFPGIPEGIIDVIPVDLVVGAILTIAAHGPDPSGVAVYQVSSGSTNPLKYRQLVDLVREWFTEHPLYDRRGQPIVVPTWSFPGRGRVQGQLERATRLISAAERTLSHLPLRARGTELTTRLTTRKRETERALSYVQLYGAYAEAEAVFDVTRLRRLWDSLDPDDQRDFLFDPKAIDWQTYVHDIHLPSVVAHARVGRKPRRGGRTPRDERRRREVLAPERHLAAFDLENTLIASNVVETYAWLATRSLSPRDRARFVAATLREAPSLLALDRRDRGDFLRYFYRRYDGAPADRLEGDAWELYNQLVLAKSFPAGLRRVREHRRLGHRTVLVTGALDFVVAPLRPLFDHVICAELGRRNGRLDGELVEAPPTGEARTLALMDYARAEGLSLAESVAYADSASDLPLLQAVGWPVAVNPEGTLAKIADRSGWLVEHWARAPGGPRPLLPIARGRPVRAS